MAGIGRYVLELSKALDEVIPTARFFLYTPTAVRLPVESKRWTLRVGRSFPRGIRAAHWLTFAVWRFSRSDHLDAFWYTTGTVPLALMGSTIRTVLTVHDLNHKVVPHTMSRKVLWTSRALFAHNVARAKAVTTNSIGTAERLRCFYNRKTDAVVPPAVSSEFRPRSREEVDSCLIRYGVDKPYILAVGTREPRKNLALLIKTFLLMKTEGLLSRHTLVAVGQKGWRNQQLEQLLRASVGTEVKSLGHVPSPDLPALYTGCDVFVFPSIYEGFGIPVSEARACGARVVATDIPETREAGDDATIYVSPTAAGIRDGIVSALAQASIAPYRAARDWQSSARILADLLTGTAASSLKFSEI